jgi:hypothetical protein
LHAALRDSLGARGFFEILKINRLDLRHIRKGESLVVALEPGDSVRFSPFPTSMEAASQFSKLLLVSIRVQAFAAYEHGRLARWGPTSTGRKETPTPSRLYHTNWKDKERSSTVNENGFYLAVNLDNFRISFISKASRPASESLLRAPSKRTRWLYDWSRRS